jgi:hypothetical protein
MQSRTFSMFERSIPSAFMFSDCFEIFVGVSPTRKSSRYYWIFGLSVRAAVSRFSEAGPTGTTTSDSTCVTRQPASLATFSRHLFGGAFADDHLDAATFEGFLHILQAFQHESVVAEVGLGVVVGKAEHHEQALVQIVRPLHGVLEGVVLVGTLGGLHPVEDIFSCPYIRSVQVLYTLNLYLPRRHLVLTCIILAWKLD